ncbi:MAG: hypothetical protein ABSH35_11095 [Isosphaeraceae bacterium]
MAAIGSDVLDERGSSRPQAGMFRSVRDAVLCRRHIRCAVGLGIGCVFNLIVEPGSAQRKRPDHLEEKL